MALSTKVVDLVGLDLLNDADQVGAVRQVPVVQDQTRISLMRILIEVVDPARVEAAGPALDAMNDVPLLEKQLCQITAGLGP